MVVLLNEVHCRAFSFQVKVCLYVWQTCLVASINFFWCCLFLLATLLICLVTRLGFKVLKPTILEKANWKSFKILPYFFATLVCVSSKITCITSLILVSYSFEICSKWWMRQSKSPLRSFIMNKTKRLRKNPLYEAVVKCL